MVRREEDGRLAVLDGGNPASCCGDPAGESPVSVSGDAPSSRARTRTERDVGQAGRRKLVSQRELRSGEQARGPQHEVKPAASSQLQSEGRAAHVTAKATSTARDLHRDGGRGGGWGAARVQGSSRNTRGPSVQPQSRQGGSYKPKAKSSAAQRKSEESIVLRMVATKNAAGGKGLWGLCRIDREGTCKGMVASRPNFPGGRSSDEDVRRLSRRLRGAAIGELRPRAVPRPRGLDLGPEPSVRLPLVGRGCVDGARVRLPVVLTAVHTSCSTPARPRPAPSLARHG